MKCASIPSTWLSIAKTWSPRVLIAAAEELQPRGMSTNNATPEEVRQVIEDCKLVEKFNELPKAQRFKTVEGERI